MIKKVIKKIMANIFFIIIILVILLGFFHYQNISKKSSIFGNFTSTIGNILYHYIEIPSKYDLGDNFKVQSTFKANLESDEYKEKSYEDPDYYKKNKILENISKLESDTTLIHSKEKQELLLTFNNKIGEEDVYSGKAYIANATQYYMVNKILENYVNEGNNSYFETLTHSHTTKDNIDYLYQTIINSLKRNIREEELKKEKQELTINDKKIKSNQISLKITDKYYKVLLKRVLYDLKKDQRSKLILESIIPGFNNIEVDEEKVYLEKNEYYVVNIYVRNILNTPIKYEIIHTTGDTNKTISLIGNLEKGNIYYYDNNKLKYTAKYEATPKIMEIIVNNEKETAGFIKVEKSNNSLSLNVSLALEDSNIDLSYSSIYKNYKKNTSYTKENMLNIKWLNNDKIKLNGNILVTSEISNTYKIIEDAEDSLLRTTLDENKKNELDKSLEEFKNRLER